MSQVYPSDFDPQPQQESGASGLAIAALVLGIIGLIISPLALVGLVLGIIAVSKSRQGSRGMAIAGLVLSCVGMALSCVMVGILLPALGQARQAARQIKSSTQERAIVQALILYSNNNQDAFPEPGSDWQARLLAGQYITANMLTAPQAKPGDASYFYLEGKKADFSHTPLVIDNPDFYRGRGANVAFADATVEYLTGDDFWGLVEREKAKGAKLPFSRPPSP